MCIDTKILNFSCFLWLNNIIIGKYLTGSGINHRFNHIYTHAGSLHWLTSSRLLFSYSIDISLSNDLSSQLGIKGRTSNLELSNKPNRKAVLPLLYMAEKVYSMFLPVRLVSWSGRFSTRTAPGLIGSLAPDSALPHWRHRAKPQTRAQASFFKEPERK